jgi:hypothetical protein
VRVEPLSNDRETWKAPAVVHAHEDQTEIVLRFFPTPGRPGPSSTGPRGPDGSTSRSTAPPPGPDQPAPSVSVISRVAARPEQWDAYLGYAKISGGAGGWAVDKSVTEPHPRGVDPSLLGLAREKAWCGGARARHHRGAGRRDAAKIPARLPLRVGQVTARQPAARGTRLCAKQRLDETETGRDHL